MRAILLALLIVAMPAPVLLAQQPEGSDEAGAGSQEAAPAEAPAQPSAPLPRTEPRPIDPLDRTMQELEDLRREAPAVPAPRPGVEYVPARVGAPSVSVDIDRSILGVAPGQPLPTLRREGEFIVNRRGRVVRSPDGAHVLFQFEADSATAQEPPMVLQPCRNLQAMEDYVVERGDTTVFIVSGQVHVYRGANYLLPTTWKLAYDQGNLQP